MKNTISFYIKRLNSVGVHASLLIIRNCFSFLSYSFTKVTIEQLDDWIKKLENPNLDRLWLRQKQMKYPDFILYFAIWHFRDKTLHNKKYSREILKDVKVLGTDYDKVTEITNQINREIDELTAFDGVIFLGDLIGAWMLSCPQELILSETTFRENWQPNESWLKSVFPETLGKGESSEELELLYRVDCLLYYTFEDVEAHNTE